MSQSLETSLPTPADATAVPGQPPEALPPPGAPAQQLADARGAAGSPLQAVLARTGHTAVSAGRFLVVQGGITRDNAPLLHTLLLDLQRLVFLTCALPPTPLARRYASLGCQRPAPPHKPDPVLLSAIRSGLAQVASRSHIRVRWQLMKGSCCRPVPQGAVPASRFRHTTCCVTAQQGSRLHAATAAGLAQCPASLRSFRAGAGHLLLLTGGYDTLGREYGGPDLEVRKPARRRPCYDCRQCSHGTGQTRAHSTAACLSSPTSRSSIDLTRRWNCCRPAGCMPTAQQRRGSACSALARPPRGATTTLESSITVRSPAPLPSLARWRTLASALQPQVPSHQASDVTGSAAAGGSKYLVLGGEGHDAAADADEGLDGPPVVYVLDVQSLSWQRLQTVADSSGHHPGLRALHASAVRLPASLRWPVCFGFPGEQLSGASSEARTNVSQLTGPVQACRPDAPTLVQVRQTEQGEDLVVVGGYSNGLLAPMTPYALNLSTLQWHEAPRPASMMDWLGLGDHWR